MNRQDIIDVLNKDLKNEWKHLKFYLYHASAITGLHREEYREMMLKNASSEMEHVTQFCDMIIGLGGVPTDEANSFEKFSDPKSILGYALWMEKEVVSNYVERIKLICETNALGDIDSKYLEIFLEDQIKHSREDVDNLNQILQGKI